MTDIRELCDSAIEQFKIVRYKDTFIRFGQFIADSITAEKDARIAGLEAQLAKHKTLDKWADSKVEVLNEKVTQLEHDLANERAANGLLKEIIDNPPKHKYWGAGEADCPADIRAGNGELHTLRCKVCGEGNPKHPFCKQGHPAPAPEGLYVELVNLLQSILVAGNFEVETFNERRLADVMEELGYPVLPCAAAPKEPK